MITSRGDNCAIISCDLISTYERNECGRFTDLLKRFFTSISIESGISCGEYPFYVILEGTLVPNLNIVLSTF